MNAHALLTSQGWRGSGHSLHPTSDATGLSRPLLVSQKANTLGLGKKQHRTSDMWWMNAFNKSLQGLDTSEQGKVIQTVTNAALDMVVKGGAKYVGNSGGLYASFVKGEPLSGTLTPEDLEVKGLAVKDLSVKGSETSDEPSRKKKKKGGDTTESKEERRARKAAKRARRAQEAAAVEEPLAMKEAQVEESEEADDASVKKMETKEERRERKRQKLLKKAEREAAPAEGKKKKKKRRNGKE